jgi:tripartite-type tricarboxylate transporter receptor subunit TctC
MQSSRRTFLHLAAGTVALLAVLRIASAQTYPTRPISLVVPFAAGGAVDTAARIVAEKLQEKLQQSVLVENRPGAGSMIGSSFVAKAPPDGYTLLLMEPGAVLAKWLNKNVAFDVTSALSPIALFAKSPLVLFSHPSAAFGDLNGLIAYSKANPGRLSVGIPGVGTPHHLAAAWLNRAANIDIRHVPYRAVPPALNDLLAGEIPLVWGAPASVMPFVEQGKVKMLAVSTQERDPLLPQVPTVSESGVAEFDIANWFGVAAPANVSPAIVVRLGQAIQETAGLPDVQQRMSTLRYNIDLRDGDRFRDMIVMEDHKYGTILREAGIKPE